MPGREEGRGRDADAAAATPPRAPGPARKPAPKVVPRADDTARARPTGSGGQQRRPSTARRPARSGRTAVSRTIRMHGLLGLSSTRRAAVLALVVCALVLSVAVPLRNYLAQRGTLQETEQQQDTLRRQVDELEQRRTQLLDPTQVEVEARKRLRYVKPGETPYVVQLPTSTPEPVPTDAPRSAEEDQWYGQMWRSIAGQEGDDG